MLIIKIEVKGPDGSGKTLSLMFITALLAGLGFKTTTDFDQPSRIETLRAEISEFHPFSIPED